MPAGNIQIHLHKQVIAIRFLQWVFQFTVGWTEEKWPKVIARQDRMFWWEWLWFQVFIQHETPEQYHRAIGQ